MTTKSPAYQWYVKEWLSSPTRLMMTKPERSAYRDLLDYCWDSGKCRLPEGQETLRKLADCTSEEWLTIGPAVLKHFVRIGHGYITNQKLRRLWIERKSFSDMASHRGEVGANARWHKHASSMQNDSSASASASASVNHKSTPGAKPPHRSQNPVEQQQNVESQQARLAKEAEARRDARVGAGAELPKAIRQLALKHTMPRAAMTKKEEDARREFLRKQAEELLAKGGG